jgi:hypothetical protein
MGWAAYTTDPIRGELAWAVRWHPEHGRSVALYRDEDVSDIHSDFTTIKTLLLTRAGGYWWDGTSWFRPLQIWDRATERFVHRPVPAARTITAADLQQADAEPDRARILSVKDVTIGKPAPGRWSDALALWARHRSEHRSDAGPLSACLVNVTAPELSGDQLVGAGEMAEIAEVAASTLRAYISRGEGDVPQHQATVSGRSVWARPVAEEWAERRRYSTESVTAAVSIEREGTGASVVAGIAEIGDMFTAMFHSRLWENPARRKRWALRWRTEAAVHTIAQGLGRGAAASIPTIVPGHALAVTVQHALLGDFAESQKDQRKDRGTDHDVMYYVMPQVAQTLDWLIRHDPVAAIRAIAETIGEAERKLGMDRATIEETLHTALNMDGKLKGDALEEFLTRAFSPAATE